MSDLLTQIVVWLNAVANALGRVFYLVSDLPGWLSITLIAVVTGIGMLLIFKHASNQKAIRSQRRAIRANLLTGKLFKDNIRAGLRAQLRVFSSAGRLLLLALVPMVVMMVPVLLLLGQIALWYQLAPVPKGEEFVVAMKLKGQVESAMPKIELAPNDAVEDVSGPVQIISKREVCWNLRALKTGYHSLTFRIDGQTVEKELAIGDGLMRVSGSKPEWNWWQALLNPRERPFTSGFVVKSIEIEYPSRPSFPSGSDYWLIYWFIVSLIAGFLLRGVMKVNI